MGFKWDVTPGQTIPQMTEAYTRAVFQSGRNIAYEYAEEMETYAMLNAPWTDRTTDARSTLHATVEETGPVGTIVLAHGMPYGLWLEIANGGRYAIIAPTIDVFAPQLMRTLQNMMNLGLVSR